MKKRTPNGYIKHSKLVESSPIFTKCVEIFFEFALQFVFHYFHQMEMANLGKSKVIREKSRGEGSLIVQDTIENVSESNFFLKLFKKKNIYFLVSFYAKNVFTV